MSKRTQNNLSKHDKDTKIVLQEMKEARKTVHHIKAELLEHNNVIKLHTEQHMPEKLHVNTEHESPKYFDASIRTPINSAPKAIRYNEEKPVSFDGLRHFSILQKNSMEIANQWLALPFQIASVLFQEWKNSNDKQYSGASS